MKNTKKAQEAREPVKVYENDDFTIYTIPLNYQVNYKVKNPYKTTKLKSGASTQTLLIPQANYCPLNRGLDYAIELAEYSVKHTLEEYKKMTV